MIYNSKNFSSRDIYFRYYQILDKFRNSSWNINVK